MLANPDGIFVLPFRYPSHKGGDSSEPLIVPPCLREFPSSSVGFSRSILDSLFICPSNPNVDLVRRYSKPSHQHVEVGREMIVRSLGDISAYPESTFSHGFYEY